MLPVIGGLQFYFITVPTVPTFDFNLGGLAMEGELPGVSGIIRSCIPSHPWSASQASDKSFSS
jgi:hypothetical protein